MKRLIEKFIKRFRAEEPLPPQESVLRRATSRPKPRPAVQKQPPAKKVRLSTQTGGKIADGGPGKNVFVRNKYDDANDPSDESLKILDESLVDAANSDGDGIDPYNTGRFDRSKSWDSSRFRK